MHKVGSCLWPKYMDLEKPYGQVDGDGLGEELLQKCGTHCTPKNITKTQVTIKFPQRLKPF